MTLRDLYCYTSDTQNFIVLAESGNEGIPLFQGKLEDCDSELMDEIVDHFTVSVDRDIIVTLCI